MIYFSVALSTILAFLAFYWRQKWINKRGELQDAIEISSDIGPCLADLVRLTSQLGGHPSNDPDWERLEDGSILFSEADHPLNGHDVREVARSHQISKNWGESVNFDHVVMLGRRHARQLGLDNVEVDGDTMRADDHVLVYYGPVVLDTFDRIKAWEDWVHRDVLDDYASSLRFDDRTVPKRINDEMGS